MPMRLEKDLLCQVGRRFPIAGKSKAPARDALIMPLEQFVDEDIALTACPLFRFREQFFVGDLLELHRRDYSEGCQAPLSCPLSKTAYAASAEQKCDADGQDSCATIHAVKTWLTYLLTIVAST